MDEPIRSHLPNENYRRGWDETFAKAKRHAPDLSRLNASREWETFCVFCSKWIPGKHVQAEEVGCSHGKAICPCPTCDIASARSERSALLKGKRIVEAQRVIAESIQRGKDLENERCGR
jgi:hypothetical protein